MSMPELGRRGLSPAVVYTAGRLALFLVVAAALYLVGFRAPLLLLLALVISMPLLLLLALVISMPLSYLVLRRQREAFAEQVARKVERRRAEKETLRAALRGDDSA
jgi:flagellar biosynthesis component FlhA